MKEKVPCPCCSGKEYIECCQPWHTGALPENALQLMRSRFSAFALNLPDYIIATTHPANPQYSKNTSSWKKNIIKFGRISSFLKLEIHGFKENGNQASVTFTAYITKNGIDVTYTEKSDFEKVEDKWLYLSGQRIA